jgi:hypothetical protein
MPESRMATTRFGGTTRAVSAMRPPASVYLAALVSRFEITCARRSGSASIGTGVGSSIASTWRLPRSAARGLDGGLDHAAERDPLAAQLELALGDARHVEQVVEQPGHLGHLALDDLARPTAAPRRRARAWRGSCAALRIGASGLRSSCASVARNSSLRRSATRSSASIAFCAVTSCTVPITWSGRPSFEAHAPHRAYPALHAGAVGDAVLGLVAAAGARRVEHASIESCTIARSSGWMPAP